jgi:hypothetical protein
MIVENMYAQCDEEGNHYGLMEGIVGHKTDGNAVARADTYIKHGSNKKVLHTTNGWNIFVEWKDGSASWEILSDPNKSNQIEVAEYVMSHKIDDEPVFMWWVPSVLKNRNQFIIAVNKRYHKLTHKFGIAIPKGWDKAIKVDKENGNTHWQDATRKEMRYLRIAFKILNDDEDVPPTFQKITCHMMFYVKMEDFRRKARFVTGWNTTEISHFGRWCGFSCSPLHVVNCCLGLG